MPSKKQTQIQSFFQNTPSKSNNITNSNGSKKRKLNHESSHAANIKAENLGLRLHSKPIYMTPDSASWYIHVKKWLPPKSQTDFDAEWKLHPKHRKQVHIFGTPMLEPRWSQAFSSIGGSNISSIFYSGLRHIAKPIQESAMIGILLDRVNELMVDVDNSPFDSPIAPSTSTSTSTSTVSSSHFSSCDDAGVTKKQHRTQDDSLESNSNKNVQTGEYYNACLQNWYQPNDSMGLHSDDEHYLIKEAPIFSLSWGGTRRFLFRSNKKKKTEDDDDGQIELWLQNGDLLVMGGMCQQSHKHELPRVRKRKDPMTTNRINWTVRAIKN